LATKHYDYFVFGHRHLPMKLSLEKNSEYINLGDWISYFTYGVFDGGCLEIASFKEES
jgi:UDP-2,3-diacylglucosamine hydrolase